MAINFHSINLLSMNLFQGAICTHVGLYDPIKKKHDVRNLQFFRDFLNIYKSIHQDCVNVIGCCCHLYLQ